VNLLSSMVDAASMNPDPWALSREQLCQLVSDKYPWYSKEALSRLLTAYDTSGNCLVRYIKLSLSLICAVHGSSLEVKPGKTTGLFKYSDDGLQLLVRMLHSLYEHVDSGIYR
jgi:hypothetical protein